jgi:hypothetical protein
MQITTLLRRHLGFDVLTNPLDSETRAAHSLTKSAMNYVWSTLLTSSSHHIASDRSLSQNLLVVELLR